jgi:hypothetical protein
MELQGGARSGGELLTPRNSAAEGANATQKLIRKIDPPHGVRVQIPGAGRE